MVFVCLVKSSFFGFLGAWRRQGGLDLEGFFLFYVGPGPGGGPYFGTSYILGRSCFGGVLRCRSNEIFFCCDAINFSCFFCDCANFATDQGLLMGTVQAPRQQSPPRQHIPRRRTRQPSWLRTSQPNALRRRFPHWRQPCRLCLSSYGAREGSWWLLNDRST